MFEGFAWYRREQTVDAGGIGWEFEQRAALRHMTTDRCDIALDERRSGRPDRAVSPHANQFDIPHPPGRRDRHGGRAEV